MSLKHCVVAVAALIPMFLIETPLRAQTPPATEAGEKHLAMAEQIEKTLWDELNHTFPACIDEEHGGFRAWFTEDWKVGEENYKTIVMQSRTTWVASQIVMRRPQKAEEYRKYAKHGVKFIDDVMWDKEKGGFYWGLSPDGKIDPRYGDEKHAYGISFGIYAASSASMALKDEKAKDLALRAFRWLDEHAHDKDNGGYFEALTRDGTPIMEPPDKNDPRKKFDKIGTLYGCKSMNSHIHLLEAVTELHKIAPDDPLVKERLVELHKIVRDKIYTKPGCLNQFFLPDWHPLPHGDSFGHDIETSFLLVEAAHELGIPEDPATLDAAKRMVDHALEYGWDKDRGGFYELGPVFGDPFKTTKGWWTQAEGLNALLLMHELFGNKTERYFKAFEKQWNFISKYQLDSVNGGWYWEVTATGVHKNGESKANEWKGTYHTGRAMLNTSEMLRKMAAEKKSE